MKIALIPARGGSKRIPQKNIRPFAGKPIIAYSIEAALQASCFDAVIVSTDDPAIVEIAQQYGAEVPFMRPAEIANDYATTTDVIRHALLWFHQQQQPVDALCCLYATAPFVRAEDLLAGYHLLAQDDTDYVFSATRYSFPIQRAIKLDAQQRVSMFQPEHLSTRSQDLPEAFHDAGQFYWGTADAFLNSKPIFSPAARAMILPRQRVQDIDTPEDWEYAELMFRLLHNES
ncbi:MAG: pseudaminic acid cytidylyltransferase [Plesiomonas sp.]|uniref:pseudaminic acid cytidylyltransferase n=1 Tax=Plesiomonas sp. TaxID=2486279 RepID=UPI003F3A3AD5